MPNPPMPTVSVGSEGDAVRWAQRAVRRGLPDPYAVAVDGIFGPETETAVMQFQEGVHLKPDGIVGPETWAALPYGCPMPELSEGFAGDVVRSLQEVLTEWAPNLVADGIFGSETHGAVEAFQGYAKITPNGVVAEQTWDASVGGMMQTLETRVGVQYAVGAPAT